MAGGKKRLKCCAVPSKNLECFDYQVDGKENRCPQTTVWQNKNSENSNSHLSTIRIPLSEHPRNIPDLTASRSQQAIQSIQPLTKTNKIDAIELKRTPSITLPDTNFTRKVDDPGEISSLTDGVEIPTKKRQLYVGHASSMLE